MEKDNVISMEEYRDRRDRQNALARAAYWAIKVEDTARALEYAQQQCQSALREAGMYHEE